MKKILKDSVFYVLVPIVMVLLMIQFIRPITIKGVSMMPFLKDNSKCLMIRSKTFKRRDVVVFRTDEMRSEKDLKHGNIIQQLIDGKQKILIKRIIGLPGDSIEVVDSKVKINGEFIDDFSDIAIIGDFGPYEVPEESYFMLGDNRNRSKDSRYWDNPYVEKSLIKGKVWIKYFPSLEYLGGNNGQ